MKTRSMIGALLAAGLALTLEACGAGSVNLNAPVQTPDANVRIDLSTGAPTMSDSTLPPEIAAVSPLDTAQTCRRPAVEVDLLLTDAMRKNGSLDPSAIALTLDGQDVTAAAVVRQTQTYPASRISITFTPAEDLALGLHQASIAYPGAAGASTFHWTFTVTDSPCS